MGTSTPSLAASQSRTNVLSSPIETASRELDASLDFEHRLQAAVLDQHTELSLSTTAMQEHTAHAAMLPVMSLLSPRLASMATARHAWMRSGRSPAHAAKRPQAMTSDVLLEAVSPAKKSVRQDQDLSTLELEESLAFERRLREALSA